MGQENLNRHLTEGDMSEWMSLSSVWLFVTPWTRQFMEFSMPEYWSGYPFSSPRDLLNPGFKPRSPALQEDFWPAEPQEKPKNPGVGSLYGWQMSKMKRCSASNVISEMQIKQQWDATTYLSEWPKPRTLTSHAGKCRKATGSLTHCWWACKLVQPLWRQSGSNKQNRLLVYDPRITQSLVSIQTS